MAPPAERAREPDPLRLVTLHLSGLLVVAVTALIVFLMTFVADQRRTVDCLQAGYGELTSYATAARSAAAQDRQAQRELLLAQVGTSEAVGDVAIDRYIDQLDAADRTRDANPIPARRCT